MRLVTFRRNLLTGHEYEAGAQFQPASKVDPLAVIGLKPDYFACWKQQVDAWTYAESEVEPELNDAVHWFHRQFVQACDRRRIPIAIDRIKPEDTREGETTLRYRVAFKAGVHHEAKSALVLLAQNVAEISKIRVRSVDPSDWIRIVIEDL